MKTIIDIEIIANSIFKSLFNIFNNNEQNIVFNILNIKENIKKEIIQKIDNKINDWVEVISNGQQDLNEDVLDRIDDKFKNMYNYFDEKLISLINIIKENNKSSSKSSTRKNAKGRNTELTEYKKYIKIKPNLSVNLDTQNINSSSKSNNKESILPLLYTISATNINIEDESLNNFSTSILNPKPEDNKVSKIDKYNIFNYDYILKNKKGFLFKENDIWYTYNLYEQKIVASDLKGIFCNYCEYTRYNSSPCIFRNCENRKYGDDEFIIYKKINGKEMESKYNKKYVNNNVDINSENEDSEENTSDDED